MVSRRPTDAEYLLHGDRKAFAYHEGEPQCVTKRIERFYDVCDSFVDIQLGFFGDLFHINIANLSRLAGLGVGEEYLSKTIQFTHNYLLLYRFRKSVIVSSSVPSLPAT